MKFLSLPSSSLTGDEIHELQLIADDKFFPSLTMFGSTPIEPIEQDSDISSSTGQPILEKKRKN
jgi:hypothetical protein